MEQSVTGGLCSSEKPTFKLFLPSASFRVRACPAGVNVPACGRFFFFFAVNVHFECDNFPPPSVCDFFVFSISVSIVTISVFSPAFLPCSLPKHQFPIPTCSSRLSQPKPLAFLMSAFFFKNGFFFIALSFLLL